MASEIGLERRDGVALLTLQAPERRNALRQETAEELIAACDEIDADERLGAVVVRGAGGYFCAGADRATLACAGNDPATDEAYRSIGIVYRAFVRVGELLPPTIAAVRGGAVGAGLNLVMATDLRVVADDARLISGFARIGLHPGGGHFQLVGRVAGRETAAAMGLFGEEVSGRRAADIGLAWAALPDAEVEEHALALAVRTAADPALARATARSFRLELGPPPVPWPVALETERATQMWSLRRRTVD